MADHRLVWPGDGVDPRRVGGKAASLMALHQAGVPVPPFVVVATDASTQTTSPEWESQVAAASQQVAGPDGVVAVRSSATAEDLRGASFAGQYHSQLYVHAPDEVMDAVERVWRSLDSPAAIRYRQRLTTRGAVSEAPPAMAVVIMRQIAGQRSGVVFTRDPTGHPEVMRVESVAGTAERLVAGAQTPEVWQVPRGAVPDDPVLADVVRLGMRCEEVFGQPQDVEWVWDGQQVWIVQSRPITTTTPQVNADAVTTAALAEMLPAPLSPLVWDTAVLAVEYAMSDLFHHLGVLADLPGGGDALIVRAGDGAGLRVSVMEHVKPRASRWERLRHDLRVARLRARALTDAEVVLQAVEGLLDHDEDLSSDAGELWRARQRHLDLLMRVACTEVVVAALAVAAFDRLERFLQPYVHDEAALLAAELMEGSIASPVVTRWLEAAEAFRRHPVGRRALRCESWEAARQVLANGGDDGRALLHEFERVMRRAGSRSVAGGITWAEEPQRAWSAVLAAVSLPVRPAHDGAEQQRRDASSRLADTDRWRRRRVLTGMVIDSQHVLLRRYVAEAGRLLQLREATKSAMLTVGGVLRRLHVQLARVAVADGWIAHVEDLESRSAWEIHARLPTSTTPEQASGDVLSGWPASAGCYEGRARLVTSPEDELAPGEVLVAYSTDPSWSPLFMRAGALVVEQGGPLSHAAVIARELGLPAVVNVAGLTKRVHTGMRLRVDGRRGDVTIESDGVGDAPA